MGIEIQRIPQYRYVDAVRWFPAVSALERYAVVALFDSDCDSSSLEIQPLKSGTPQFTWELPSRITSLRTSLSHQKPLIAASTVAGSFHVFSAGASEVSLSGKALHAGPISCIDLMDDCVTVGEDGRVNLVTIGTSHLTYRRISDSNALLSHTAAKWASPAEFATGGYGFALQWWDQRSPAGPVSHFNPNWPQGTTSGIVHSIDIHPSRKHTCLAGGSLGTVFAWDLRWQQQPVVLSGFGAGGAVNTLSESDVWEVQYDRNAKSSNISSSKILPVMICSEDGILAIVEEGEDPTELLAEPCAINSFDIDRQDPSNVICSLEWESIAIVTRS